MNSKKLIGLIVLIFVFVIACAGPETLSEQDLRLNPNEPWTGTWKVTGTPYGNLVLNLKQSGNKIKSIRGSTHDFRGKVKGNRLKAWYIEMDTQAPVDLKISQDSMSFKGKGLVWRKTFYLKGERQE